MFRTILVPVDLSERATHVLEFARDLALRHQASLTLLHVIEAVDGVPFDELEDFYRDLERRARDMLDRFSQPLRDAGLAVEARVCYGKRAGEIVRYADENEFDLMVLGSHRLTPDNFHSGFMTISHQVAIATQIPVLVVKR